MRNFVIALAALFALAATPSTAATFTPYNKAALETSIKSGAPVVVHVHAEWCPVCRRQISVLDELFRDPKFAKVQTVRVNYDRDLDFLSTHKIKRQATILTFKGGKEVARIEYDADAGRIRSVVAAAQ
jgi:thioredoxin 1